MGGRGGAKETRWLHLCLWRQSNLGSIMATWASQGDAGPWVPIWELPVGTQLVGPWAEVTQAGSSRSLWGWRQGTPLQRDGLCVSPVRGRGCSPQPCGPGWGQALGEQMEGAGCLSEVSI